MLQDPSSPPKQRPPPQRSEVRRWDFGALERVHHAQPGQEWVPHWHDEWSIGAIVAGDCMCSLAGERTPVRAGDCLAIAPGRVHTGALLATPDAPAVLVVMLYVPPDWFGRHGLPTPGSDRRVRDPALTQRARHLATAADAHAWLVDALAVLARGAPWGPEAPTPTPAARQLLAHFREAALTGDCSVAAMAAHCGVSREMLHRVVRRWTGLGPAEYLRVLRVHRARELVLGGEPVGEAAAACGFADQAHFIRWFRRMFGYTPGDLRARAG